MIVSPDLGWCIYYLGTPTYLRDHTRRERCSLAAILVMEVAWGGGGGVEKPIKRNEDKKRRFLRPLPWYFAPWFWKRLFEKKKTGGGAWFGILTDELMTPSTSMWHLHYTSAPATDATQNNRHALFPPTTRPACVCGPLYVSRLLPSRRRRGRRLVSRKRRMKGQGWKGELLDALAILAGNKARR